MIAAVAGGLALGLALGFLGSGGSILAVPILVYLLGQEPKVAIAGSLAVVGAVALAGALEAAWRGAVAWRAVLLFGLAGVFGSALGAAVGARSRGAVQLAVFGLVMLWVAAAMSFRRVATSSQDDVRRRSVPGLARDGLLVGA